MNRSPESPKIVLITGASGGLGTAMATAFIQAGWLVAGGYRNTPLAPTERLLPIKLDVSNEADLASAGRQLGEQFGKLDALINNAGILEDELLLKMSEEQFERVLETNLKGVFCCCRSFTPLLQKCGGHIVNIGSYVGRHGNISQANYAASKAGLIGLAFSLAREFGPANIRVNTIFPGGLKTKMTSQFDEARWEVFAKSNVLGRVNTPEEIARFVQFLCTTENISGQVFALDSRITSWC